MNLNEEHDKFFLDMPFTWASLGKYVRCWLCATIPTSYTSSPALKPTNDLSILLFLFQVIPKSILNASHDAMLVFLTGQGYQSVLRPNSRTLRKFTEFSFTIDKQPGSAITDFQFQSMLSNLTSVQLVVRSNLVLREVLMESAVYDPMSDVSAHVGFVENMSCFSNYTGLSCETCAPGKV